MKLKKINSSKKNKNYKINIIFDKDNKSKFFVGDKVLNKISNEESKIIKIDDKNIFIQYNDKTIERINKDNALQTLSYIEPKVQLPSINSKTSSKVINRVLDNLSQSNEIFENEKEVKYDKNKSRINEEYELYLNDKNKNEKNKKINDIINLGISKGLIDKDEFDIEKEKLLLMTDRDFEDYVDNILNFNSQSIVTSLKDEEDDPNLTEAERALAEIKKGNNLITTNIDYDKIPNNSRSLDVIASNKKNTNVVINNVSSEQEQYSYDKNNWMKELDWTLLSKN